MKKKLLIIIPIILLIVLVLLGSYFMMNNMEVSYYVYGENNKLVLGDTDLKKKVDLTVNLGVNPNINVVFTKKHLYFADNYNNKLFNLNKVSINDAFSNKKGELIDNDVSKYNVVNDLQNITFLEVVNDNLVYRSNKNLYLNDEIITDSLTSYLGYKGAYYYVKSDKLERIYSNKVITKTDLNTPFVDGCKIVLITSSTCTACQEFKEVIDIVSETYNLTFYNYDYPTLDSKVKEGLNLTDLKAYPSLYIFDDKNNLIYFNEGKLSADELVNELTTLNIIVLNNDRTTYTTAKYNTTEEIVNSGASIFSNNYLIGTDKHKFIYNTDTNKLVNYPDSSIEIIEVLNNKIYYYLDSKYFVGNLTESGITSSSEITGEIIKVSGNNVISKINGEYLLGVINEKYELITEVSSKDLIYINNKTYFIKDNNLYNDSNNLISSDYIFTSNDELYSVKDNTLSKVNDKNKITLITNDFMKDLGIVKTNKK